MKLKQFKKSILIVNSIFLIFLFIYIPTLVYFITNDLNTNLISNIGLSFIFLIPISLIWGHWASNKIKQLNKQNNHELNRLRSKRNNRIDH